MTSSRAVTFAGLAAALASLPAAAQTVTGTLAEPGGTPVEQVLVVLVDSTGHQGAAGFTDAAGAFTVVAPAPGRYSLRAERIGYTMVTSGAFDLRQGETRTERLTASGRPLMLQGIRISATGRRCSGSVDHAVETATLWGEARKALNATAFTERERLYRFDVVRWSRDLDLRDRTVLRDVRRTSSGEARHPFVSGPPEELSRRGFVRATEGDSTEYWAPDANVMLSERFLNDHCFRVVAGSDPALVGLAFEPARGRGVPDVAGTLWLDRASAELRRVEFHYVGGPPESRAEGVGGTVEYARLPGGRWIVRRWAIRMPLAQRSAMPTSLGATRVRHGSDDRLNLAVVRESGGEVTGTSAGDGGLLSSGAAPVIEGVVWDSTRGAPLAGARVYLSGTAAESVAGPDGRFRLQAPAAGTYTLGFTHPELGPLRDVVRTRTVTVAGGGPVTADLAVPGWARARAALCADSLLDRNHGIVFGRLEGERGDTTLVSATWSSFVGAVTRVGFRRDFVATRPDAQGFYVLCGIPEERRVQVGVRRRGRDEARAVVTFRGVPLRQDISVEPPELDLSRVNAVAAAAGVQVRQVEGSGGRASMEGFDRRRHAGQGVFLDRAEVQRRRPVRLTDLFQGISGVQVVRDRSGERVVMTAPHADRWNEGLRAGASTADQALQSVGRPGAPPPRGASAAATTARQCMVQYIVDGVLSELGRIPGNVDPMRVEGVEIYRAPAEVPAEFRRDGSGCGVIVLWTRASAPAP